MPLSKAIITSSSNKFFPSLLNFLGSIKARYPEHPPIFVYDLGLSSFLKKEISQIPGVSVISLPQFVPFWRSCYTWKTYILNQPLADLNFYIDAGTELLQPLDTLFDSIEKNGYLLVSQGHEVTMKDITPTDYIETFDLDASVLSHEIIAAGIFGFNAHSDIIRNITRKLYAVGQMGLCLGFSEKEQWKNKGKNANAFVRQCERFRHDTTMLSVLVWKYLAHPIIEPIEHFDGKKSGHPQQYLWSVRMNYSTLTYLHYFKLGYMTRAFIALFLYAKKLNALVKSALR
jgi:hypothetical protein